MHCAFCGKGKRISPAQANRLSKIANILTTIMRREEKSADTIQSLLSYDQGIKECYDICFVDVRVKEIEESMTSSKFLAPNSTETYTCYIGVGKMMTTREVLLPLFGKLCKHAPAEKTLGITHLDDSSLYTSSENDVRFMNQTAAAFVRNGRNLLLSTRIFLMDTSRYLLNNCMFATRSKAKKSLRPLRCSSMLELSKPK